MNLGSSCDMLGAAASMTYGGLLACLLALPMSGASLCRVVVSSSVLVAGGAHAKGGLCSCN